LISSATPAPGQHFPWNFERFCCAFVRLYPTFFKPAPFSAPWGRNPGPGSRPIDPALEPVCGFTPWPPHLSFFFASAETPSVFAIMSICPPIEYYYSWGGLRFWAVVVNLLWTDDVSVAGFRRPPCLLSWFVSASLSSPPNGDCSSISKSSWFQDIFFFLRGVSGLAKNYLFFCMPFVLPRSLSDPIVRPRSPSRSICFSYCWRCASLVGGPRSSAFLPVLSPCVFPFPPPPDFWQGAARRWCPICDCPPSCAQRFSGPPARPPSRIEMIHPTSYFVILSFSVRAAVFTLSGLSHLVGRGIKFRFRLSLLRFFLRPHISNPLPPMTPFPLHTKEGRLVFRCPFPLFYRSRFIFGQRFFCFPFFLNPFSDAPHPRRRCVGAPSSGGHSFPSGVFPLAFCPGPCAVTVFVRTTTGPYDLVPPPLTSSFFRRPSLEAASPNFAICFQIRFSCRPFFFFVLPGPLPRSKVSTFAGGFRPKR